MQLSREADYAVRTIVELASRPAGRIVPLSLIAAKQLISPGYLKKIARRLASAGLVSTFRGRSGGIRLDHPAETLSLLQVISAIEGPLTLNRCLVRPGECALDRTCPVYPVWHRLQELMIQGLSSVTIAELGRSVTEDRIRDLPPR